MDDAIFWAKFNELAKAEKERQEKTDYGFLSGLEFHSVESVNWVQFSNHDNLSQEEKNIKLNQLTALLKKYGVLGDAEMDGEGMYGGFEYDAELLKQIDRLMGIEQIHIEVVMVRR